MASHNDSQSFEYYELIPRDQTLRRPVPDKFVHMHSQPFVHIQLTEPAQNIHEANYNTLKQQYQKQFKQMDDFVSQLKLQLDRFTNQLTKQKLINENLNKVLNDVKHMLGKPELQTNQITNQLQQFINLSNKTKQIKQNNQIVQKNENYESLLIKKQQEIRNLKHQLFQSTANNINAIFHTELSSNQIILKQIQKLSAQFQKVQINNNYKHDCKNQQKTIDLIKKYEQMLQLYHSNEKQMYQIKQKQQQNFIYFSAAKSEMSHSIYQACSNYTNQRLGKIQQQIKNILQNLNNIHKVPEKVKTDQGQDIRVKELIHEIQKLNQIITQKQIEIQKMNSANQQLLAKSRGYEKDSQKIKNIETTLKDKEKRIKQLQHTIIDYMDSRAKDESFTSQESDVQKQKMNIRNLKVLVLNLKEENKNIKQKMKQTEIENNELKKKISNISSDSDRTETVQKVSKDQASFKVVEDIVGVLLSTAEMDQKCKCLQKTADCLLNLNEEYPELQGILQGLGIIQKTSNLLPVQ